MGHLLKIEWLKIKNYKAFWVFAVLYLVSIFIVNYIGWTIDQKIKAEVSASEAIIGAIYAFPKVWQTVGWFSSWLLYFPGMVLIMLMVNEFNFKTHRQNIIDGWSRNQFIGVKIALAVIFAIVITLINSLTAVFFGTISKESFSTEGMEFIGYIFLQAIAYMFFALMLAVLFRRSGLAIIVFFLYGLIFEWLITGLTTYQFKLAPAGYFLPLQASDVLIPMPFAKGLIYPDTPSIGILIAVIAAYIGLYVFFARKKFVHDDL
jgi:mannose/fructose/N-acetylgalactosamine-specific phosphotransferase system component IIC